jgi:hypothetical protein
MRVAAGRSARCVTASQVDVAYGRWPILADARLRIGIHGLAVLLDGIGSVHGHSLLGLPEAAAALAGSGLYVRLQC